MNRHPIFSFAVLIAALAGLFIVSPAQKRKPRPRPVTEIVTVRASPVPKLTPDKQRRQDAFVKVWTTLNDYYFDKTFSGLDWAAIRREYQPLVDKTKTDEQLHALLQRMIDRLGRSHFAIIPPDFFSTLETAKVTARTREKWLAAGKKADEAVITGEDADVDEEDPFDEDSGARFGIGVELRIMDDKFVISRVEKGSSADTAGIKPGFIIDKINGVSLNETAGRILTEYASIRNIRRHLPMQIVAWFLNGDENTSVFLTCLDGTNTPKDFKVPRMPLTGELITLGSRFPAQFLEFRTASLSDSVGYIKFNIFAMPVIDRYCAALTEFAAKKAIVVDLRGNVGGVIGTLVALTGMSSERRMTIGTSLYRVGIEPLSAEPKAKNFKGKLIFLVDDQSISAAEFFAASMQDNHRAIVVGSRTAGEALPSVSASLATGAVLVYPIADFRSPSGRSLEGNGVEPDYSVALDRTALLAGVDTQLEKALALIRDNVEIKLPPPPVSNRGTGISAGPPPPPAPKLSTGADVQLSAVPSSAPPPPAPAVKDEKALQAIAEFTAAIGGLDELNKVRSYQAAGSGVIGLRGTETEIDVRAYRQTPDRFALFMASPAIGEVREIYNGKDSFLQTDYGLDQKLYPGMDTSRMELFPAIFSVIDTTYFSSLKFEGSYDLEGRKLNVVTGKIKDGLTVGMAFDAATKLLTRYAPPGMSYSLGDYRKVDGIMLPFSIELENLVKMKLDSVTLNPKIDPANFEKKEKCFDKPLQ